jgi:hypothetical protein
MAISIPDKNSAGLLKIGILVILLLVADTPSLIVLPRRQFKQLNAFCQSTNQAVETPISLF